MRLVTCIGSISSGKTCLLNILQEQAIDGKCYSTEEQEKIAAIQEEFNYKPNKEISNQKDCIPKNFKNNRKRERNIISNKVAPIINENSKQIGASTDNKHSLNIPKVKVLDKVKTTPINISNLLGKTAPTIGVNHFEFIVDDLTLQVAGKYWIRKKENSNNICQNISCKSTEVNSERIDAIELRELGGEIGKYL